ncbi:MAG: trypsin-like peptidase domain-containing protein [Planctomycetota bacterium]
MGSPARIWSLLLLSLVSFLTTLEAQQVPRQQELRDALRAARDRVFPTLVHIRPVLDLSRGGKKTETMLTGSGVIVSSDGLVITNFHVAGIAKRMICTLADRRRLGADLVGADAATDLALIRLRLDELNLERINCAEFGDMDGLEVGDFVMTMGSPLGLTRSLSLGVVSCRDRYLPPMTVSGHVPTGLFNTWIQTDAAINPGNSGGPLVDLSGRVIGINTRGYRGAENLGFAIPGDVVQEVLAALLETGRVIRSEIGVSCQSLEEMSNILGGGGGVLISSVASDSPAYECGLRVGDLLISYDGQPLAAQFDEDLPLVQRRMAAVPVGKRVEAVVRRHGEQIAFSLTTERWEPPAEEDLELPEWGLTVRGLSADERRDRYLPDAVGVLVTGVRKGGLAGRTRPSLLADDVLVAVDGEKLAAPDDVEGRLLEARAAGLEAVLLRVIRGHATYLMAMPVGEEPGGDDGGEP